MFLALLFFFADSFDTTFRAGLIALSQNNLHAAESQLEAASKLQPKDARVWLALAQTYRKRGNAPAAQAAARSAEEFASDPAILHGLAIYHSETGKAYEADDDRARAIPEYQAAIRLDKFNEGYYFDLAQAFLKDQKFAAALETIDAGRKTFARSAQLELAAGVAYYGLRRFPQAIDAFLTTIRIDPRVEQPYVFLGRMLDQAEGKLAEVVEVFAAFATKAPDDYVSSFLYGKALAVEDPAQAETLLRKSVARNEEFWESHSELAALLDRQRKYEDAAREIGRAVELNPGEPALHYRLARLYDRLGKSAEARAERELHAQLAGAKK